MAKAIRRYLHLSRIWEINNGMNKQEYTFLMVMAIKRHSEIRFNSGSAIHKNLNWCKSNAFPEASKII